MTHVILKMQTTTLIIKQNILHSVYQHFNKINVSISYLGLHIHSGYIRVVEPLNYFPLKILNHGLCGSIAHGPRFIPARYAQLWRLLKNCIHTGEFFLSIYCFKFLPQLSANHLRLFFKSVNHNIWWNWIDRKIQQ